MMRLLNTELMCYILTNTYILYTYNILWPVVWVWCYANPPPVVNCGLVACGLGLVLCKRCMEGLKMVYLAFSSVFIAEQFIIFSRGPITVQKRFQQC